MNNIIMLMTFFVYYSIGTNLLTLVNTINIIIRFETMEKKENLSNIYDT